MEGVLSRQRSKILFPPQPSGSYSLVNLCTSVCLHVCVCVYVCVCVCVYTHARTHNTHIPTHTLDGIRMHANGYVMCLCMYLYSCKDTSKLHTKAHTEALSLLMHTKTHRTQPPPPRACPPPPPSTLTRKGASVHPQLMPSSFSCVFVLLQCTQWEFI